MSSLLVTPNKEKEAFEDLDGSMVDFEGGCDSEANMQKKQCCFKTTDIMLGRVSIQHDMLRSAKKNGRQNLPNDGLAEAPDKVENPPPGSASEGLETDRNVLTTGRAMMATETELPELNK